MIDDFGDDSTVANGVIIERDARVDHDDFNSVATRATPAILPTSSHLHRGEQHMPATEPERKSRKNALFALASARLTADESPFESALKFLPAEVEFGWVSRSERMRHEARAAGNRHSHSEPMDRSVEMLGALDFRRS